MFRPTPSYTTLWDVTYGEFGRVWADGALRLPNAELLAGSAANGSETRAGGTKADGGTERPDLREMARAASAA